MTTLGELERGLALFSQGIVDRIPIFQPQTGSTSSFANAHGYELVLPAEVNCFEESEANRDVYLWRVLQQLAFRLYDTIGFSIVVANRHIPELDIDKPPPTPRATDLERFYHHFPDPQLAERLFYILEEARVTHLLGIDYPGSLKLRDLNQEYEIASADIQDHSNLPQLSLLKIALQSPNKLSSDTKALIGDLFESTSNVYSSARATVRYYASVSQELTGGESVESDASMEISIALPSLQRIARLDEWEKELQDSDAELLALSFGEEQALANQSESDDAIEGTIRETVAETQTKRDQLKRKVDMEKSLLTQIGRATNLEHPHFRYDEWDYLNSQWLRRWCSVYEFHNDHESHDLANKLMREIKPLIPKVRRQFEQMKPLGMRQIKGYLSGDELDIDAVIKMRVDLRAGVTPNARVYKRLNKKQRDLSACFLVDLSASTDDPVKKPETDHLPEDDEDPFDDPYLHGAINFDPDQSQKETPRKIIDIQKESVLLLATALENLGDMYSIYGFSGYGHDCVEIHVAKEFDQTLNHRTLNAIASMKPLRSTRMGPAIRHVTVKLLQTGASLKLLMVISDGFPQDCDYGPDRSDHEYGIQDTAKAIQEARAKGVQVFCITVDLSGHDYLKRMCQPDQYLVIEETDELPLQLQRVYRTLTT